MSCNTRTKPTKIWFIVLTTIYFLCIAKCAPQYNFAVLPQPGRLPIYELGPQPRPFFGSIGDWISGSSWFPIEINVPDVIGNIVSGVSGMTGSLTNGISGIAQRFPLFNRFTSSGQPRPLKYFILMPSKPSENLPDKSVFNPFSSSGDLFPQYP